MGYQSPLNGTNQSLFRRWNALSKLGEWRWRQSGAKQSLFNWENTGKYGGNWALPPTNAQIHIRFTRSSLGTKQGNGTAIFI